MASFALSTEGQMEWLHALQKIEASQTPEGIPLRNILLDTLIRSMCG